MAHILIFIHWFVLVFTFGNVELVTIDNSKSNDFPIEELNNYTLREVFQYGDVLNGNFKQLIDINLDGIADGWLENGTNSVNYAIINDKQTWDSLVGNVFSSSMRSPLIEMLPHTYYINYDIQNISNYIYLRTSAGFTGYQILSRKFVFAETITSNITFYSSSIENRASVGNIYLIDLQVLGIDNLSLEQMDDWFNVYQENAEREISETYDYIENELTTNDLIYIVLFALLWGLAIKIVKGVM